jgi:LmbE family N-acetylglucosaminyl deacetylase
LHKNSIGGWKLRNILAIGAHPDDIEFGCAGSLALHKSREDRIYLLVLTSGEAQGDPEIREKECQISAKILNTDGLFFGRLPDTKVNDGKETIEIIEKIAKDIRPDLIYAPSIKDTHQDHRNAGHATLSACRRCNKILLYEGASALREFNPQVFIDIEKTFAIKLKATKAFESQVNHNGRYALALKALEGLARFRGYQGGVGIAEAFEVGKYILDI